MTTAAAASIPARAAGPLSRWLSVRHPLHTEAAVVLALYGPAAAGAITVALAAASARVITRRPGHARLARLPEQPLPAPRPERLAA